MCELYNISDYLYNRKRQTAAYLWLNLKTQDYVTNNSSGSSYCSRSIALAYKFFHPYGQKDQIDTQYSGGCAGHYMALKGIRAFGFIVEHNHLALQV